MTLINNQIIINVFCAVNVLSKSKARVYFLSSLKITQIHLPLAPRTPSAGINGMRLNSRHKNF